MGLAAHPQRGYNINKSDQRERMVMKKITAVLAAFLLAVPIFGGCAGESDPAEQTHQTETVRTEAVCPECMGAGSVVCPDCKGDPRCPDCGERDDALQALPPPGCTICNETGRCRACQGTGRDRYKNYECRECFGSGICRECKGKGMFPYPEREEPIEKICGTCAGSGVICTACRDGIVVCRTCGGDGIV